MNTFIRSITTTALIAIATVAMAADITPSAKYETRRVTIGSFDAISTTAIDVIYTQGPQSIEIYAPDNLIPYIKISLTDTELKVGYSERMNLRGKHRTTVKISSPDVVRFLSRSAGDITISGALNAKGRDVELKTLSAGEIEASSINCRTLTLSVCSAGEIETGDLNVDELDATTNSAGDIETGNITAVRKVTLTANSAGDIEARSITTVEASLRSNSSGDVDVKELSADVVSVHANSSGDISIPSLKAERLDAGLNSCGNMTLAGICSNANLSLRSTGTLKAGELRSKDVKVSCMGTGSVTCCALNSLIASCYGNGKIRYKGNPVKVSATGSRKANIRPL